MMSSYTLNKDCISFVKSESFKLDDSEELEELEDSNNSDECDMVDFWYKNKLFLFNNLNYERRNAS
jgi:hypothetical protein